MLFRQHTLEGIRDGRVTVAFRRWRRPTVRAGGSLRTAVGELSIKAVDQVSIDEISAADARRAGYDGRKSLLADLDQREAGVVYRIELGSLRRDSREVLREHAAEAEEWDALVQRLDRFDRHASTPWTRQVLELIARHPGLRAGDLCELAAQEMAPFKVNVRKLKNLGLTISLEIGYMLSPRGKAALRRLQSTGSGTAREPGS